MVQRLLRCAGQDRRAVHRGPAWYVTGDAGRVDADGFFYFSSRDDDVIIMAGYRIGPFDVESVLVTHPRVMETAVIGVPDALRGEVLEAFVVLRGGDSGDEELAAELQQLVKDDPRQRHAADDHGRWLVAGGGQVVQVGGLHAAELCQPQVAAARAPMATRVDVVPVVVAVRATTGSFGLVRGCSRGMESAVQRFDWHGSAPCRTGYVTPRVSGGDIAAYTGAVSLHRCGEGPCVVSTR